MTRRTQVQLAREAEARVRKERARLELSRIKLRRESVNARRTVLSVHRAAEVNRFTKDWTAPTTSADSEIVADHPRITARARQMVRDDPYAKSIVRSFRRNVVGTGITPAIDKQPYKRAWNLWTRRPAMMDMEARRTFIQVQQWAIDELISVGEGFVVRWITGTGSSRRLALQLFEVEQLDRYKIEEPNTGNEVRAGIEVDEDGAPVAYHFYRRHPNDIRGMARPAPLMLESMRVPASMVCHIYDPERVRQTHGVSRLRPVLRKLRDLSEYDAAQLRVARAEASIGLIIKGGDDEDDPLELDGLNVAYVGDNEDVTPYTPSRPGGQYSPFVGAQLRAIAAGVGISYEQLARDLSNTTYSGGRQGSIDDHREFEPLIGLLISQLCEPVFNDFVFVWSLQHPEQSGDYFLADDADPIKWQGQGWDWVDREQQGKAVERKLRLGLTTRTIEANLLGVDVESLDEQANRDGTREIVERLQGDGRELPGPAEPGATTPTRREREEVTSGA